ncbi:MAG: hypothetical protein IJE89_03740 [Bacilli bacterium]|nr:hypothetical protein [Bacilli bacterium]
MPLMGESRITNSILRMMGENSKKEIDNYLESVVDRDFLVISSIEQVNNIFGKNIEQFYMSLSEDELIDLRTWTSYNFSNINAILRNNWTYENNGLLTEDKKNELRELAGRISKIFAKYNSPLVNFIAFRGTTISSFKDYGITDLLELENLEGKFLYEQGFTSASMIESSCYFKKNFNDSKKYNIEVRYLVSSECEEGVLLVNRDTSHYSDENEYLIDKGSLSKVIDVKVDKDSDTAIITVVLIPRKIYDREYHQDKTSIKVN